MNELTGSGDPRAKVVGKQRSQPDDVQNSHTRFDRLQENFRQMWGGLPFRKGVYGFKILEEFHEWKTTLMMRNAPGRRGWGALCPSDGESLRLRL